MPLLKQEQIFQKKTNAARGITAHCRIQFMEFGNLLINLLPAFL